MKQQVRIFFIKTHEHYSDPELISLWQQGDEKAFDCLYKRYVVFLVNTAAKKIRSVETAKELVQDVFMNVYLLRDQLQTTASLKSYLFTALRNKIFNYYRNEFRKKKNEQNGYHNLHVVANTIHNEYEVKELQLQLQEVIQELPPQCRKVFLLSREEQLSHKEIAERLNISPNTVDQHLQKALRLLRAAVGTVLLLLLWARW